MITIHELPEDKRAELFERVMKPTGTSHAARRKEMQTRHDIATDAYDSQIAERIKKTHHDKEVANEMVTWAVGYFNIWKRCSRKIAVAYKRRPTRRIETHGDDDAGKEANAKLTELYRRTDFNAKALKWQRRSIIMNRIIVVALPREDEDGETVIDFEVLTGANCEVWMPDDRPKTAMPDIAAQLLSTTGQADEPAIRVFDKATVSLWTNRGKFISEIPHGAGTFPGADMLSEHEMDEHDFWDWKTWRSATAATLESGLIGASMGWTRKDQCRKIIAMLTNNEGDVMPDGQNLTDHEKALVLNGTNVQLVVHDLNTAVTNFLEHIASIRDEIAEQMTGTSSTFTDPDPKLPDAGVGGAAQHVAINEVRESQATQLDKFERRMAFVLCMLGRHIGWDVPDAAVVKVDFRCDWAPLAFIDTPENRVRVWAEETKFGIFDQVAALVEREGISEEEAESRLMLLAKRRSKLDAFRASRNDTADPMAPPTTLELPAGPGEDLAQVQGRAGGSVDADGNPTIPEGADGVESEATPPEPATGADGKPLPTSADTGDVQATALNGAQVASLLAMGTAVAEGSLPAEFIARLMPIAFPGTIADEASARRILEPLAGFKATPAAPPPTEEPPPAEVDDQAAAE